MKVARCHRDVNHCASDTRRTLRGGVKASSSFKRLCRRLGLFVLSFGTSAMVHVDPVGRGLHVVQNLDSKWQLIHNDDYRTVYLDNLEV